MQRRNVTFAGISVLLGWCVGASAGPLKDSGKLPAAIEAPPAFQHLHYRVDQIVKPSPMHGAQGLAIGPDGALYAGSVLGHSVYRVNTATGAIDPFLRPPRGDAKDLAFAPDGTLVWIATAQHAVYARGKDGRIRTLADNVSALNAVDIGPDGRIFVSRVGDGLYELDPGGVGPPRLIAGNLGDLGTFRAAADNLVYAPLSSHGTIVKLNTATGQVDVIASGFASPSAVKTESDGHLVVADAQSNDIVRLDPLTGEKSTVATLPFPGNALAVASNSAIYVASAVHNSIAEVDPRSRAVRIITSGALAAPGLINLVETEDSPKLLVADATLPRFIDIESGDATIISHNAGVMGASAALANGGTYILASKGTENAGLVQVVERASGRVLANFTNFGAPYDVKSIGDGFIVADYTVGRLTKVGNDPAHTRTTFAWNFDGPVGLADAGDGTFFVSECAGGRISRVNAKTNDQSIVIDGLDEPQGIALARDGTLIVAEVGEKRVLAVDPSSGRARVLADHLRIGMEVASQTGGPSLPTGVAVAKDGIIYVSGNVDNTIYRLTPPVPQ